jgi:hypothetical protein
VTLRTLLDPFRIAALPDLIDKAAIFAITSGRASKIINNTPMGQPALNLHALLTIITGGKESTESFVAISTVISQAISGTRVPKSSIQLVQTRDVVSSLLAQDTLIDMYVSGAKAVCVA